MARPVTPEGWRKFRKDFELHRARVVDWSLREERELLLSSLRGTEWLEKVANEEEKRQGISKWCYMVLGPSGWEAEDFKEDLENILQQEIKEVEEVLGGYVVYLDSEKGGKALLALQGQVIGGRAVKVVPHQAVLSGDQIFELITRKLGFLETYDDQFFSRGPALTSGTQVSNPRGMDVRAVTEAEEVGREADQYGEADQWANWQEGGVHHQWFSTLPPFNSPGMTWTPPQNFLNNMTWPVQISEVDKASEQPKPLLLEAPKIEARPPSPSEESSVSTKLSLPTPSPPAPTPSPNRNKPWVTGGAGGHQGPGQGSGGKGWGKGTNGAPNVGGFKGGKGGGNLKGSKGGNGFQNGNWGYGNGHQNNQWQGGSPNQWQGAQGNQWQGAQGSQ